MHLENVVLPNKEFNERFNVEIADNRIRSIAKISEAPSTPPLILLPALCHPHIHLDKAYLLTSHSYLSISSKDYPKYSDLGLESGDFKEALSKTGQAKTRYTEEDLSCRGTQLVAESIQAGVTTMRAFVEIDNVTKFKCLSAAQKIVTRFEGLCYIQLCAFAQDPIMSTEHGEENRRLMERALEDKENWNIEVLGTTPYVEEGVGYGIENIKWAIDKAIEKKLHLDFHLDYNLDPETRPLIWEAVRLLKEAKWTERAEKDKKIIFGHCSRMTLFSDEEMERLASEIDDLPVSFVGLPTSDLFMMGRLGENQKGHGSRQRGTLQIVDMIQKNGLQACIGVNNAGNAFTPWGGADPLRLACLGVGLYHAGTAEHAKLLYECVSTRASRAIGLQQKVVGQDSDDFDLSQPGMGILVVENEMWIRCPGLSTSEEEVGILARPRMTVADIVWDPPELRLRRAVGNNGRPPIETP